jgi:hypothetical protein
MKLEQDQGLDGFAALNASEPEVLASVHEQWLDGCRTAILLTFSTKQMMLQANADDDTLSIMTLPVDEPVREWRRVDAQSPWDRWVGETFGWGWLTINQQGYCDGALLSFGGIEPSMLVNVVASSLNIYVIEARNA